MMRILFCRVLAVLAIFAGMPPHTHASSQLAAIVDAIRQRSAAIDSFAFEWTETQQISKGALPRPLPGSVPQPPLDAVIPPKDVQLTSTSSLTVRGGRLRHSRSTELWCDNTNAMRREEWIMVFNGREARRLSPINVGDFPLGWVLPSSTRDHSREAATEPFRLAFRLLDPHLGMPTLVEGLVDGPAIDDSGQLCDLVESPLSPDVRIVTWFNRDRGHLPTRMQTFFRDRLIAELQIQYNSDDFAGWIPSAWRRIRMDEKGKWVDTIEGTVTSASINHRVSDDQFRLNFPRGTWVHDRVTNHKYVIRNDGTYRHILPGEGRNSYDLLVGSGPGWIRRVISMLALALILAVAVFVAFRLVRRNHD